MAPRPSDPPPSRRPRRPIHMRGSTRPPIISRITFIRFRFWIKGHHPFRKFSPEPGEQLPAPNPNTNPTPSAETPNKGPSKAKKARQQLERWLHIVPRPPRPCDEEVALEDCMDPAYFSGVVKSVDQWMDTVLDESPDLCGQLQNMYGPLPAGQGDGGNAAQGQEQGEERASKNQRQAGEHSSEEEKVQDDVENYEGSGGEASESDDGWADYGSEVPLLKRSPPSTSRGSSFMESGGSRGIMGLTQEQDLESREEYEKIFADDGASTRGILGSDGSGSDKDSESIVGLNKNEEKDEAIPEGKGKGKAKAEGEGEHIDQSRDDEKDEKEDDESEEKDTEKIGDDGSPTDNGSTHDLDDDDYQTGSGKGIEPESSADNSQQESSKDGQTPGADDSGNCPRGGDLGEHSQQEDTQDSS
ncbi:hypothetical protein EX30DRAFT_374873 [Ascodesmis nigricans]|uniref:Uncharacterized protein n=1 Tax=Ascodesmis nigricans TaxID=341454 RepID=A0A4S2MJT3_9PEZI|nr:hypothetical protein EX30DRAFT_374873 [Ascodesmis nigricans]